MRVDGYGLWKKGFTRETGSPGGGISGCWLVRVPGLVKDLPLTPVPSWGTPASAVGGLDLAVPQREHGDGSCFYCVPSRKSWKNN